MNCSNIEQLLIKKINDFQFKQLNYSVIFNDFLKYLIMLLKLY